MARRRLLLGDAPDLPEDAPPAWRVTWLPAIAACVVEHPRIPAMKRTFLAMQGIDGVTVLNGGALMLTARPLVDEDVFRQDIEAALQDEAERWTANQRLLAASKVAPPGVQLLPSAEFPIITVAQDVPQRVRLVPRNKGPLTAWLAHATLIPPYGTLVQNPTRQELIVLFTQYWTAAAEAGVTDCVQLAHLQQLNARPSFETDRLHSLNWLAQRFVNRMRDEDRSTFGLRCLWCVCFKQGIIDWLNSRGAW